MILNARGFSSSSTMRLFSIGRNYRLSPILCSNNLLNSTNYSPVKLKEKHSFTTYKFKNGLSDNYSITNTLNDSYNVNDCIRNIRYNSTNSFKKQSNILSENAANEHKFSTQTPTLLDVKPASSAVQNTDFDGKTWPQMLVDSCPQSVIPYLKLMRLDRPIGTWLLFWPCAWGYSLASLSGSSLPDLYTLSLFGVGALIMRGAGCTVNDLWDRDIDSKVARTVDRPIAAGIVKPIDAAVFLGFQLSLGLAVLMQFNINTVILGATSLGLVTIYPLVKRVSHWPQLILGLTFNWGALMGWCAVHHQVGCVAPLSLYCAGISWTLIYDTIYAHQDKSDDLRIGIKSTALKFGADTHKWLGLFSLIMVASLTTAGVTEGLHWPYYGAVGLTAANLVHQLAVLNINDRAQCGKQFRANRHIGMLIFCGIIASGVVGGGAEALGEVVGEKKENLVA